MEIAKSRKGLRNLYNDRPAEVQKFFADFPALVDSSFPLDILLAYVFFRMEQGQHLSLYCGARKLHKTDSELTWKALDLHHLTRDGFKELFHTIYGFKIDKTTLDCIEKAENFRDKMMHGKMVQEKDEREAISRVLHYAERMNNLISSKQKAGFKPFSGNLKGFVGRLESLDQATTRWILKGMGFTNL